MYNFILSMWVMKIADEEYLQKALNKNRITEEQMEFILATPQVD